jgi:hypothetical protein
MSFFNRKEHKDHKGDFSPLRSLRLKLLAAALILTCLCMAVRGMMAEAMVALFAFGAALPALLNGHLLGLNTATIKGDTSVIWGTGGITQTSYSGILTSVRDQRTGEMVEIPDVSGFTTSLVLFNAKNECEIHVTVQTAFPTWDRGSVITINGHTACIVTDYEKLWENKKVAEYNVKATQFDGILTP